MLCLVPADSSQHLAAKKPVNVDLAAASVVIPYQDVVLQTDCPFGTTVDSWIVDLACYLSKGGEALSDPDCTRKGLEAGLPPAFLIDRPSSPIVYLLARHVEDSVLRLRICNSNRS